MVIINNKKISSSNIIDIGSIGKDIYKATYMYIVIIIILIMILTMSDENILNSNALNNNFNANNGKTSDRNVGNVINLGNGLTYPLLKKYNVSSKFGARYHPVRKKKTFHYGVDFAAPEGSNLIAVTNGTIVKSELDGANGYSIWLKDENGIIYVYAHVNPYKKAYVGEVVAAGQTIGYVGPKYIPYGKYKDSYGYTNGLLTGPHLHFGVYVNGRYIDPMSVLNNS